MRRKCKTETNSTFIQNFNCFKENILVKLVIDLALNTLVAYLVPLEAEFYVD